VNRRNLKSIFVGVTAVAALAAVALTTGILRPVSDPRALFEEAEQTARSCVQKRGHDYPSTGVPLGEAQSGSARLTAYNACWTRVAKDAQFASLQIPAPAERLHRAQSDGFRHWRCVEEAGFRRTKPIAMSGPNGYPLVPAAGHFAVANSQPQLSVFFQAVARCGNMRIEDLRRPDGTFAKDMADGRSCERHRHSGDHHSHGCFSVDEYPEGV